MRSTDFNNLWLKWKLLKCRRVLRNIQKWCLQRWSKNSLCNGVPEWCLPTALPGKLKWEKNIQSIWRLLWERPRPELQNEPPLDSLDTQSPNPFMASLWIGSGEGLDIKGFGDWGSRLSSGGSFWSPGWGHVCSSLEINWIFFAISISQKVRCIFLKSSCFVDLISKI